MLAGCTRRYYRNFADRDTYRIENQRQLDWRWNMPDRPVEANPAARIGDKNDPDHYPIPQDDPGARPFQVTAGRKGEFHGWKKRGMTPIEDLSWLTCIPRDQDGDLVLNGASAMRIALVNSRDYQTQVENVYLAALQLTLLRYNYFPQILANQTTQYQNAGSAFGAPNQLQLVTNEALNWTFFSGATLLVNFANSLLFEYNGHGFQQVNSNAVVTLTQPLLKGAFARNQTQPLSLQERLVLYNIRQFAQFRRGFYVTTVSNYLNLLFQLQSIRNQENQVQAFKRSLAEYDALVKADLVDRLQRDNVAQNYQGARATLLSLEASFQTSLDGYRVTQLGLPPDFPVKLDESLLTQFELNDKRLDTLRKVNEDLYLGLRQFDAPPDRAALVESARKLLDEFRQLKEIVPVIEGELNSWRSRLEAQKGNVGTGPGPLEQDAKESYERQVGLAADLAKSFKISSEGLDSNVKELNDYLATMEVNNRKEDAGTIAPDDIPKVRLKELEDLRDTHVGRDFRARLSELFVIEIQARVYLIDVNRIEMTLPQAISVGLANRLDLMNAKAQVTDAWRNVEVAGNALLAGVNVFYNGFLGTPPGNQGVFNFDPRFESNVVGIRFDAPIVRRTERNNYRADQITLQRARRAYMLTHDTVVQEIRLDMRQLNLARRQFEIAREQLLIAARQVDLAEYNARSSSGAASAGGQSAGLNLINALNSLLGAKNTLISDWIQYEIQRMSLFRDFDIMDIDAQGVWTNDRPVPTGPRGAGTIASVPDPVGSGREGLLPRPATQPDPVDLDAGPLIPGQPAAAPGPVVVPPPAAGRGPFAPPP